MITPKAVVLLLLSSVIWAQTPVDPTPVFPGAVVTDGQLMNAVNNCQTTLYAGMVSTDTTLTLTSPNSCFVPNMLIAIGGEIMKLTSISPTFTVVRAWDGTTAAAHAQYTVVSGYLVAWHHNAMKAEVESIEATLGPNLSNIPNFVIAGSTITGTTTQPLLTLTQHGTGNALVVNAAAGTNALIINSAFGQDGLIINNGGTLSSTGGASFGGTVSINNGGNILLSGGGGTVNSGDGSDTGGATCGGDNFKAGAYICQPTAGTTAGLFEVWPGPVSASNSHTAQVAVYSVGGSDNCSDVSYAKLYMKIAGASSYLQSTNCSGYGVPVTTQFFGEDSGGSSLSNVVWQWGGTQKILFESDGSIVSSGSGQFTSTVTTSGVVLPTAGDGIEFYNSSTKEFVLDQASSSTFGIYDTVNSVTAMLVTQGAEDTVDFGTSVLKGKGFTFTAAAPTVSSAQVGFGSTVAASSSCGSLSGAAGCLVINVAGTTRYVPYY